MSEHELHVAADLGAVPALPTQDAAHLPASDEQRLRMLLEQRIVELERELARTRGREESWRAERSRLLDALEKAEREVATLPALQYEVDVTRDTAYWLAVVKSSWSWRLTRPLRAASRLARRVLRRRPPS